MRVIDLSQDIYQGMQVYPGHSKTAIWEHASHDETALRFDSEFSFQTNAFTLNDNGPTHVDSFSHLDPTPGAATIDQMDLRYFFGPGICLDVSHVEARADISVEDLSRAEESSGHLVRPGDTLLLHTGTWNRHRDSPSYLSEHPGLGHDASQWIADHEVKVFGVDAPTPDNPSSRIYPCHLMCREFGITHYENLANLDQLVGERFFFIGLPLKLIGSHGGPTRAVALVDLDIDATIRP